jgi:CBS domain-containing protein
MAAVREILLRKGTEVARIAPDATALDAACSMNSRRIGSLVVVEKGEVVGIVTERDIMTRVVADERDPSRTLVREIMTAKLATCTPEMPLEECRELLIGRRIRRLPVIVDGELSGIITQGDVMRQEMEEARAMIGYLNEYMESPPTPPGGRC